MIKKIQCRVVRSVPLRKSSYTLWHASRSNNEHHRASDVDAASPTNVQVKCTGNSVIYTIQVGVAKIFTERTPAGQILDYYV